MEVTKAVTTPVMVTLVAAMEPRVVMDRVVTKEFVSYFLPVLNIFA